MFRRVASDARRFPMPRRALPRAHAATSTGRHASSRTATCCGRAARTPRASSCAPRASLATHPSRASAACRLSRHTRRPSSPLGRAARAPRHRHRSTAGSPIGSCGRLQAGARAGRGRRLVAPRSLVAPPWRPPQRRTRPSGRRGVLLQSGAAGLTAGRTSQASPTSPRTCPRAHSRSSRPAYARPPGVKQAALVPARSSRRRC